MTNVSWSFFILDIHIKNLIFDAVWNSDFDFMTDTQSLMQYLMMISLQLSTQNTVSESNTTNANYSWKNISLICQWSDFNYNTIKQYYDNELNIKQITFDSMSTFFSEAIRNELLFHMHFVKYILLHLH